VETLAERVARRGHRPLLKDKDPLEVLRALAEIRNPLYAQAQLRVRSCSVPHERAVEMVIAALREWEDKAAGA
jgi:shikimate kinase